MKRLFYVTMVLVLLLGVLPVATPSQAAPASKTERVTESPNGVYIVQMVDEPVVAYEGGIKGLRATAPKQGWKIDPLSPDVVNYVSYLVGKHDQALSNVGGGQKLYDYTYSFNGFAAQLSLSQANKLASVNGVIVVNADELQTMDTSSTPTFLGLNDPGGLWDQLGGVDNAGEGIIIGLIDSGIWPESPSFSDRTGFNGNAKKDGKLGYQQIPGWHGKCVPGEAFNASMCNQKLIGAQFFNAGWGGDAGIDAQRPWEFNSARDYNGHGSHTSSTAGGNHAVVPTGPTEVFGPISGMAPRARIAMYKGLWSLQDGSQANGYNSDLVMAIDQAVADGVDVISYSISGSLTNFLDPVMFSFLYAARAGIFVSAAAGNSGPAASTVAHPSPWVTTVAAGTHNRSALGTVTFGDGSSYVGASVAATDVSAPLIDSINAGLAGADATQVSLCYSSLDGGNVLDPAKVTGKIVVCDRGTTARVNKSLAVKEAGGVGMVLVNPSPNTLNADFHSVPTVHLPDSDYAAVHAYAATPSPTATIHKATIIYTAPAPLTASFSSRGPLRAGGGDLLKPDVMAPGVDVLAAVSPASGGGFNFNLYSGTSMSAPHVAGVAALLKQAHPSWTPMMIKSAMMTTGYDVLDGPDTDPSVIFSQGAGHIKPNNAVNPGLVYNSGWLDWLAFLCGTTTGVAPATCTALVGMGFSLDPSDFNVASIAIGQMIASQTVTRNVTNVGSLAATYTASYTGMAGFDVVIDPSSLTLNPGQTKSFSVTFTWVDATLNAYTGGQLTWTDGSYEVRIPMVVKPVALTAPASVSGTGGTINYDVTFGYSGPFTATARGLIPPTTTEGSVMTDPTGNFTPVVSPYAQKFDIVVPAGTTYARFALFDSTTTPGSDLDLYVYRGSNQVGSSTGTTATEEVNLVNPTAATYTVWVHGYTTSNPSTFTLFNWLLGTADAGNMTVTAPATAVVGTTGTISLSFSGLAPATKYLGSVAYGGAAGMPNPTIVRVDTP